MKGPARDEAGKDLEIRLGMKSWTPAGGCAVQDLSMLVGAEFVTSDFLAGHLARI